jgi:pimeloyl-ACP methyl ester carboxylesterase
MNNANVVPQDPYRIEPPFYPIVYVRGFAPTAAAREGTFHDLFYGYADTSVESRPKPPSDAQGGQVTDRDRIVLDVFEGQLIRFIKEFAYIDASHGGLELAAPPNLPPPFGRPVQNPTRSIWISRFYDQDFLTGQVRSIDEHARDLWQLIHEEIPAALRARNAVVDGSYKVILIAHSMGGLVCRTLIQNLLPFMGIDPKSQIHRLVTIASPHGGIEMSSIPDAFENFVVNTFNPGDTRIFKEEDMRRYLKLDTKYALNSLGELAQARADQFSFPVQRCFCLIGSDWKSYDPFVQKVTGNYSDGLVKQDRAFIEGAFTANVHRAHSGNRGVVNSFESYENIHRFLFGDTKVQVYLDGITLASPQNAGAKGFYNFEFALDVRNGGGVHLHQRREDPCENALRFPAAAIPQKINLHTLFLNSQRQANDGTMNFLVVMRVVEHRVEHTFLWDHEYSGRTIFSESLEVRVRPDLIEDYNLRAAGAAAANQPLPLPDPQLMEFQWLSDPEGTPNGGWKQARFNNTNRNYEIDLRAASSLSGTL